MENKLMLLGDVAAILGVKPHRITYLFSSRKLDDVQMLGKRRVFAAADVRRVADALGIDWNEQ